MVKVIDGLARSVAHKEMNATIDEISLALPGRRHSTRFGVMLENVTSITIHLGIAASGESG
jgi:hypothetical protein